MASKEIFRKLLSLSYQIGAEKVANMDNKPAIKGDFSYGIYGELKEEIECHILIDELSETEKDALIFSFCKGWTHEVLS